MVGLKKKYRGSTFVEALVAQVIILVVFSVALVSLSSVYKMALKSSDLRLDNRLAYLEYSYENKMISLPYDEEWDHYQLNMSKSENDVVPVIEIEIYDKRNDKIKRQSFISANRD